MRLAGFGVGVAIAATLLAGDAQARAERDLARRCNTVNAFVFAPTAKELTEALAEAGTRGKTRLDLGLTPFERQATESDGPEDGTPNDLGTLPPPTWKKPVDAARAIAGAKTLVQIKELILDRFPIDAATAKILAASPHLAALESLSLRNSHLTGAALHELLAPGAFPGLVALDITDNRMKAADLQELAGRLAARKLRRLAIGARHEAPSSEYAKSNLPRDAAATGALARIAATPSLATLDLTQEPIRFGALEALLKVPRQQPLEIVTEAFPNLSAKQLEALAALDPEAHISFSIEDVDHPSRLRALDRSGLLAKVTALSVACGDACARIIAGSANTRRLRKLDFGCEEDEKLPFTKATTVALSRATGLPALRELGLYNEHELCKQAGIGPEGMRALIKAPFAGQLESLTLEDQSLADAGHVALAKATTLGALKELAIVEERPILTAATTAPFLRDGALAAHLEVLSLQNESSEGWPIGVLAKGIRMPKLRALVLPETHGKVEDWLRIARAPGWEHVRLLSMSPRIEGDDTGSEKVFAELRKRLPADACLYSP